MQPLRYTTNSIELDKIKYFSLPGNRPEIGLQEVYEKTHLFWHTIWSQTFREVKDLDHLSSDSFTNHQEVLSLFYHGEVVGIFLFNWFNLNEYSSTNRSYFDWYCDEVIQILHDKNSSRIMTMGHLAVHKDWRKSKIGFPVVDLIMGLATTRFINTDCDCLLTYTRNDRKTNELCYRFGGRSLLKGTQANGIEADVIYFEKDFVVESQNSTVRHYVKKLWAEMTFVPYFDPRQNQQSKPDINMYRRNPMNQSMQRKDLDQFITETIDLLYEKAEQFPWENEQAYANWISQSYYYVAHTTRLLALASSKTNLQQNRLHLRFLKEADEEKAHEKLLEHDMVSLGHEIGDYVELPETSFFYQTLFYMVDKVDPVSIFGYSLTLEGLTAKKLDNVYHRVRDAHGEKACTFLKVHCELDTEHFTNGTIELDFLNSNELKIVKRAMWQARTIYINMLSTIAQNSQELAAMPSNQFHELTSAPPLS